MVRLCEYVPGRSTPAEIPPVVLFTPTPLPLPSWPPQTTVAAEVTARQRRVYRALWDTVNSEYVAADFNGRDWPAIGEKYAALIEGGLADEDFYYAMQLMLAELGDEHSQLLGPEEAARSMAEMRGQNDYSGFGVSLQPVPEVNRAVILYVFADSPAAAAGLRPHDSFLKVNGRSALDADGYLAEELGGPEGSWALLTVQRPGEPLRTIRLRRQRIVGAVPIDYCLIPGTRVAYLYLPTLISRQVRAALRQLTATGPLDGLILDNRENDGGIDTEMEAILSLFTHGYLGEFVGRHDAYPLYVEAEDIGGSQTVPLVILAGQDTASYAEILSGVLQNSGRARLVGSTTPGNVETLWSYDFEDGSLAWIAHAVFRPPNLPAGIWEETGIIPDVGVPARWDLFTEATDPALPAALELLANP